MFPNPTTEWLTAGLQLSADADLQTAAISQANHALPFEAVLLAMLVEQQKKIDDLQRQIHG